MKLLRQRLALKHLVYVMSCGGFLALILAGIQLYVDYRKDVAQVYDALSIIRTSYIPALVTSRYDLDEKQLEILVEGIKKLRDIQYVQVVEGKRKGETILAASGDGGGKPDLTRSFELAVERNGNHIHLGTLFIHASFKTAKSRLKERALIIVTGNIFKTIVMSLCILWIIHYLTIRHLLTISRFALDLDGSSLTQKLVLNRSGKKQPPDELDGIVNALNAMTSRVRSYLDKINLARQDLESLNATLTEKNATLNQEIKKRELAENHLQQAQKMESVGRLAGGVAHDFNNMLGVILGHTELALLKADEDNDLISDLKEIQNAAKRSADITKQLLAFARKQTISPKQIDLNDTVESMLNMLRQLIGEDIDLVWQPGAHLWPVKMDPSQIDQILANLCVNARDAISGVGKLIIETGIKSFDEEYCGQHSGFIPGDFVLLAVSDNGCGMEKNTLANLFEPFFTTKEVGKGTGLGLATVYGIVKQNNGFINVYSELGQGSTFRIYLPRLVGDEDTETAVPDKKAVAGGTETILLVEDEPSLLRMTRMMLERKGYNVLSAATPTEAVEKATHHSGPIDMLMTDVVMPEMNGRDLAGQITDLYPDIRLLFMSGYTSNVIAHHGVLDDGVAFIQKPFSLEDMTEKVRELLDMASDKNQ